MSNGFSCSTLRQAGWRFIGFFAAAVLAALPLRAAVLADIDGDGWSATDANLGVPWTSILFDVNSDVWGSGEPGSGLGVAFSGPATQGQSGLFDDHIIESVDLVANLSLVNANVINFRFYQESMSYSPNALSVYFQDFQFDDWYRNIAPPGSIGWTTYSVSLSPSAGWYSPTGGSNFSQALGGGPTQHMGIRLQYEAGTSQIQRYGLADYEVLGDAVVYVSSVPEPSTASFIVCGAILIWGVKRRERIRGIHQRR